MSLHVELYLNLKGNVTDLLHCLLSHDWVNMFDCASLPGYVIDERGSEVKSSLHEAEVSQGAN